jgi:hypothetical protein
VATADCDALLGWEVDGVPEEAVSDEEALADAEAECRAGWAAAEGGPVVGAAGLEGAGPVTTGRGPSGPEATDVLIEGRSAAKAAAAAARTTTAPIPLISRTRRLNRRGGVNRGMIWVGGSSADAFCERTSRVVADGQV